jgi:hypothetical protein
MPMTPPVAIRHRSALQLSPARFLDMLVAVRFLDRDGLGNFHALAELNGVEEAVDRRHPLLIQL